MTAARVGVVLRRKRNGRLSIAVTSGELDYNLIVGVASARSDYRPLSEYGAPVAGLGGDRPEAAVYGG